MPSLIDSHCHLNDRRFADDRDDVLARARQDGVEKIVIPAIRLDQFDELKQLCQDHEELEFAIGIHPHKVADHSLDALEGLGALALEGGAVAIGEIGLDYHYDFAPRDMQRTFFRRQLEVARESGLPAVIHNRESDDDLLEDIESVQDGNLRFQLHCFSSDEQVLRRALDLGATISFTGNITFKNHDGGDVVRSVPEDRLMIETDAPYLTPVPYRGKRNEPARVRQVAERIAELRNVSLETVADMTTRNATAFFRLVTLAIFCLIVGSGSALAQGEAEFRPIDTTESEPYDRLFGIGPQFTATTFIIDRATQASGQPAIGGWFSLSPLQPLGINWLQLDVVFTNTEVPGTIDSTWIAIRENRDHFPPPNQHNTLDIGIRLVPNHESFINLYGSLGFTRFYNRYGVDRYIATVIGDTATVSEWEEVNHGFGIGIGVAINFRTPYGVIAPTGELHFSQITGERTLPRHKETFLLSQPRFGLIFYPAISDLLFDE